MRSKSTNKSTDKMEKASTGTLSVVEREFLDFLQAELEEIDQGPDSAFGEIQAGMHPSIQREAATSGTVVTQCSGATGTRVLGSNPPKDGNGGGDVELDRTRPDAGMDSRNQGADLGYSWIDELIRDQSETVTWPIADWEDDAVPIVRPPGADLDEAPPSANAMMGETDPMSCGAISRSAPPDVEGNDLFTLRIREDAATSDYQITTDFGKPSADVEMALSLDLFEGLTWPGYDGEDAEKTSTSLESARKPKEESQPGCSFMIRDAPPSGDASKANAKSHSREQLADCTNLMETRSHSNTGKPQRDRYSPRRLLKRSRKTSSSKQKSKSPRSENAMKPRQSSWRKSPATGTRRPKQQPTSARRAGRETRQSGGGGGACASTSEMNWPLAILTGVPKVKSTETLSPDEKMQMMANIEQAQALLLTLVYQDGGTQLQSEESPPNLTQPVCGLLLLLINDVDGCHGRRSLGQNDLLLYHRLDGDPPQAQEQIFTRDVLQRLPSRAGVTVCYRAKEWLSAALRLCRQHLSWKQVSGCRILDPQVSGWLLDPEDPCSCYPDLFRKHTRKSLPPATPATVLLELYSLYCLNEKLCAEIRSQSLWSIYSDVELKMIPILAAMESQRIQMDTDALMHLSDLLERKMNHLEKAANVAAGQDFLMTSPIQIRHVLFKKLRLQEHFKKKRPQCKKETASAKTLQMYQDVHPLPKIIQEYREVKQAKSNFVDDTYVHMLTKGHFSAKWSQTSVVTGRLCSANPNFDAVPSEPLKIALMPRGQGSDPAVTSVDPRAVYVSEEGWTFVAAGFCQLELRLLAHFSGDRKLVHLFRDAEADAYALLASEWAHERAVSSEDTEQAKRIVSSILYGKGRDCLANTMGVTMSAAHRFQDDFFLEFPKVKAFTLSVLRQGRKQGFVRSLLGRQRPVRHILSEESALRLRTEKKAIAYVLQGSAADLCKMAMIRVSEMLSASDGSSARLMAQFKDELLFEVKDPQVEDFSALVEGTMESLSHIDHLGVHLDVPLKVAVSCGKSWGSMSALHVAA
ncbi:DNA polymerase nu [Syngnathus scovelli]|uniref:DNA polymerase nu n=1 Tax=Syngnathus scovelli TaxID=161590 RepID=UPI0035CAFEB0